MDASLLQQAAAQAKTGWLEQALTALLPQVWALTTEAPGWQQSASAWAAQIAQLFEQKKLTTPGQQKNRRTDVANALRTIDPHHPAIPFVLFPAAVYTQLNNEQATRLNARENKFFSIQQANELVERAIALLESDEPDAVAAGLAVLAGRRISELLLSEFKPKTAYSLLFSAAVKRRGAVGLEFEIPTLAPADQVLEAIAHLQDVWQLADLKALALPDNQLKRRINARYSGVPQACRQHFAALVPGREAANDDGERLYTHLFRAVYAEIATYYYKPEWVPDHRFKAEIQGHFKLTTDGQKIPNYSARQSYDDYLIHDRTPGRPGVKLGLPGVERLAVFQQGEAIEPVEEGTLGRRPLAAGTMNALLYRAVDRLLFSQTWAETVTGLVLVTGRAIQTLIEKSLEAKSGFAILVDGLEVPTLTGASQVVAAWKQWQQLAPLPTGQVAAAVREVCHRTFADLATLQSVSDLRAVYSAIALHWFCPPEIAEETFLTAIQATATAGFVTARAERGLKLGQHNVQVLEALKGNVPVLEASKGEEERARQHEDRKQAVSTAAVQRAKSRQRRKTLSVDPDCLKLIAAAFGLEIRAKGGAGGLSDETALKQVLAQLAPGHAPALSHPRPDTPQQEGAINALQDQAKTLAWLTGRMEALAQQVETLQLERDAALAQVKQAGDAATVRQLQQEKQRLRQERDEANSKLQALRQLLLETGLHQEAQTVAEPQSQPIAPTSPLTPTPPSSKHPEPPQAAPKHLPAADALEHIRRAVQAIMALNDQESRAFDAKWYISFPVVQTLLRAYGLAANQKNVAIVFAEMKAALELHHAKHQMGSRHNRKHPKLEKIKESISLSE